MLTFAMSFHLSEECGFSGLPGSREDGIFFLDKCFLISSGMALCMALFLSIDGCKDNKF